MSRDQKDAMQKVLRSLLDPYRKPYQDQVLVKCLEKQGGCDQCHLIFYQERTLGGRRVGRLAHRRPGLRLVLPRLSARTSWIHVAAAQVPL